jgi:hypothetical protein
LLRRRIMNALTLPCHVTLESDDDDRLAAELRVARLRSQVAVVRALADQIEHFARSHNAEGLTEQLAEEMARLGYRLFEAAASLTRAPSPPESGVVDRRSSTDCAS